MNPSAEEQARRDEVFARILQYIREDRTIRLPAFDRAQPQGGADYALLAIEQNEFSGTVRGFRYQFEGEDDLLHVAVWKSDTALITVQQAQKVVSFLLPLVSPALIWLRPGRISHHFYVGHDDLAA